MTLTAAALRELHRIHRQLADLRERLERGPKQVAAREANVIELSTRVAESRELVKQTQMASDQKQLNLKSGEQKIIDLRAKLNACSSNREYQSFLEQIAASEMANSVLADEILEGMEKIDELNAMVGKSIENEAAGKQELEKTRTAVAERADGMRADITRLEEELVQAEATLPNEFKSDYQRVVRAKGADGLSVVDDGVCLSCGFQITLNMQNELLMSRLVFCKSCGCLLYLEE